MKNQMNVRVSDYTREQIDALAVKMNTTQTDIVSLAINRLHQEVIVNHRTIISFQTAIKSLALNPQENRDQMIDIVNNAVEDMIQTPAYNDEGSDAHTHLRDWLYDGEYAGNETAQSLATEWDEASDE